MRRVAILFGILAILVPAALSSRWIRAESGSRRAGFANQETAAPAVVLALAPTAQVAAVGDRVALAVEVRAGGQPVDAAAAYLNFDPGVLQVVRVEAGSHLNLVLENAFDNAAGTLDFAAGKFYAPFPSGTFTLATVTFVARGTSPGAAVVFNQTTGRRSNVTRSGESVLKQTQGATVVVGTAPSTATPVATATRPPEPTGTAMATPTATTQPAPTDTPAATATPAGQPVQTSSPAVTLTATPAATPAATPTQTLTATAPIATRRPSTYLPLIHSR